MNKQDKLIRLQKYADDLKRRLSSDVPQKHANNVANFRQMLEIDLRKTNIDIERLKLI